MKLNEDKNNYVTNPTHLVFDNYDSKEIIEIYSGDRIDKEYSCNIYIYIFIIIIIIIIKIINYYKWQFV